MRNSLTGVSKIIAGYLILSMTLFTASSCKKSNPTFESLSQIEGTWEMKFDGSAVYEEWNRVNDTLFAGRSYEVSNGDTVPTESIQIISNEQGIFYVPTVIDQNDGKPVYFKLDVQEGGKFVFENPNHDFPTNITYEFQPNNKLKATVSGLVNEEMRSLEFEYVKIKK